MEQYLSQMLLEVSNQRQALERECLLLEDLLKPWQKKKCKENNDEKEKPASVKGPEAANHDISHEERQALFQVDELLLKAQKTRQLKAKMKPVATTDERSKEEQKSDSKAVDKLPSNSSGDSRNSFHTAEGEHVQLNTRKCTNAITSSRSQKENNSSNNVSKAKNFPKIQHANNRNTSTSRSSTPKSGNGRPSSSNTSVRPTSARGRHMPAHMSAPFKTDAHTRVPKRRLNHLHKNQSKIVAGKCVPLGAYRTLPDIKNYEPSSKEKRNYQTSSETEENKNVPDEQDQSDCSNKGEFHNSSSQRESEDAEKETPEPHQNLNWNSLPAETNNAQNTLVESTDWQSRAEGRDCQEATVDEDAEIRDSRADLFFLKQNGSSLIVPSKLRKAVAVNNSLRDRCSTAGLTRRVSSEDAAQQFVDKLDAQSQIGQELWSRVCAMTCLKSHEILLETLHSLNLDQLSEHTSYNDIYRAKCLLEFVLTTFAELQKEADYFFRVQFRKIKAFPKTHIGGMGHEWHEIDSSKEMERNHIQGYLSASKEWMDLKFKEKYFNLHIFLINLADSEWLKYLIYENRDPSLLQSVYGLLTTCGQSLPALIENPDVT